MRKAEFFLFMIVLNKGNNAERVYCTPLELLASSPNFYFFKFTNRTTGDVVTFFDTNESNTARYQYFTLNTQSIFGTFEEGFWGYTIQPSSTNTGTPNTAICESGLMYLKPAIEFEPTKYDEQDNTFKVFNG